jgi:[ribosomal protein S18]-alanine N-acetyltransferase
MTTPVHVTFAQPHDAPRLRELLVGTESPFDVDKELARPYARLWVARLEPTVDAIGFLLAWDVVDEIHVIDVVVETTARRRGVGRALLEALLSHARARAARLVLLEVRESNVPAIGLYRGLGFENCGERTNYYSDGETALEMRLSLSG